MRHGAAPTAEGCVCTRLPHAVVPPAAVRAACQWYWQHARTDRKLLKHELAHKYRRGAVYCPLVRGALGPLSGVTTTSRARGSWALCRDNTWKMKI